MEEPEFITVYVAAGQPEAFIVKGRLEEEGIFVILRYESLGIIYGITVDGLGQVKVQVPQEMEERAKAILESGTSQ